ncbi:MAG: prepilin-type N-terminal cleavage/methylation domain-containing protein [Baekduia sp.]
MARPASFAADDGMTLIEVLVTMVIGMVVMAAALTLMTDGFTSSARVQDRADASGRARQALDRATSLLQAQICNGTISPVIAANTTSITFTANNGDPSATPVQYQLRYVAGAGGTPGRLEERRWTMGATPNANGTYPLSAVGSWIEIVDGVEPVAITSPATPVFRYYGTDNTTTNEPKELTSPYVVGTTPIVAPLPAGDLRRVLRVDIDLRVLPARWNDLAKARRLSSRLHTSAYVTSNLDPVKLEQGPQCSAA